MGGIKRFRGKLKENKFNCQAFENDQTDIAVKQWQSLEIVEKCYYLATTIGSMGMHLAVL